MKLISEDRKSNSIRNLQNKFPYDQSFIRRIFDLDPTYNGKYSSYIEKTLPYVINSIAGEVGGLNVGQQTRIENLYSTIRWFELNSKYITPKIIEEFFKEEVDEDSLEKIIKSPKDINSYKNPFLLEVLKKVIEQKRSNKEKENIAKSQVNKIFEDDLYLVIEPLSYVSSCYYGKNTKWCVSANIDGETHFNQYIKKGRLIFFIDKKIPSDKVALFIPKNDNLDIRVFDSKDDEIDVKLLYDYFPELSNLIGKLTGYEGSLYEMLKGFKSGVVSPEKLKKGDPLINKIRGLTSENRGSAMIILDFKSDDDYFDVIDLSDDDKDFVNRIFNPYSDMELMDSYSLRSDWHDGVIYEWYFDDKSKQNFDEVVKLVDPRYKKDNEGGYNTGLYGILLDFFPREFEDIIYEYANYYNDAMADANKEIIVDELGNLFSHFNIHTINTFDRYFTSVDNLISLYGKFNSSGKKPLSELLKTISSEINYGNYWDHYYEVDVSKLFNFSDFNRNVMNTLDKIMEKIEEDEELGKNLNFIKDLNEKIFSKFIFKSMYYLPTDKNIKFVITDINREQKKIEVGVLKPNKPQEFINLTIEEFFQFINTYPLYK